MNRHLKPCDNCTKVERPDLCHDQNCKEWQAWFIKAWDDVRNRIMTLLTRRTELDGRCERCPFAEQMMKEVTE